MLFKIMIRLYENKLFCCFSIMFFVIKLVFELEGIILFISILLKVLSCVFIFK